MNIRILCVGKIKEKYWNAALAEYMKRLTPFCRTEIIETADEKTPEELSDAQKKQILDKEGERLLRSIRPGHYVIALAIEGQPFSSEGLAEKISGLALSGKSDLTFIIGGSLGLSSQVLQRADLLLSFSRLTFPHQLMRVILLEQIYRSFKIINGQPYHK